ncbi:MAG: hypothetical protein IH991_03020 [Planctomycetes bacterium]|nr:hypothetical protein [Planctomycetota bacterium]
MLMLACGPTNADYEPIPLHELVVGSDLLVRGTIIEVREKTFEVEVLKVIRGRARPKRIEVQRFVDWSGNARWTSYQAGQGVLLFLVKQEGNGGPSWQVLGAGGEGEMPIEGEFIYCHGTFIQGFKRHQGFAVQGGTLNGYKFELTTFLSAIAGYHRCFKLKGPLLQRPRILNRTCTEEAIENYRRQSALHRHLIDVSRQQVDPKQK